MDCRSEYIFLIEDLITGKKEEAHGRRLKFFRNNNFDVSEELKDNLAYNLPVIERIEDIRRKDGGLHLLIKWRGFDESENDLFSLASLREYSPVLVSQFTPETRKCRIKRQRSLVPSIWMPPSPSTLVTMGR